MHPVGEWNQYYVPAGHEKRGGHGSVNSESDVWNHRRVKMNADGAYLETQGGPNPARSLGKRGYGPELSLRCGSLDLQSADGA